jgi:predicted DNA-binding protein
VAAKNPRVNAVLEPALYERVEILAKREGVSLSQKVRDLVRDALELLEDEGLESRVETRRRSAARSRWVSHREVKRRLRIS